MIARHRIAAEVHDVIRHCARAPHHLRALDDRYTQLKSDPTWDQADADKVSATALQIITGVPDSRGETSVQEQDDEHDPAETRSRSG